MFRRWRQLLPLLSCLLTAAQVGAKATVNLAGSLNLLWSQVEPGNILPGFLFLQVQAEGGGSIVNIGGGRGTPLPFIPTDGAEDDIWEGANPDLRSPQLPWLTQDIWGCQRKPTDIPVIELEDDKVKATITPQVGGKIWALYDKVNQRDMVYNNRAHQPANIGARKAWAAGGIEFNWSPGIIGHSAFTEESAWTAVLDTELGPVVRVYEFDRYNGTVWQVDILINNGTLFTHARITNPTPKDLRGYWWTCVAHHTTPDARVITPASKVACETVDGYTTAFDPKTVAGEGSWHKFAPVVTNFSFQGEKGVWSIDQSYLGNTPYHNDYFVRIRKPTQPFIAHVETDGYTVSHVHPLNGTKFFTWGHNGPGRFMQDFLAGGETPNRQGDYVELQIGPAPTQLQTFPLPANSTLEWSDYYSAFYSDNIAVHSTDYSVALDEVTKKMAAGVSQAEYNSIDSFLARLADRPVQESEIVHQASSWGALEMSIIALMTGNRSPLAPGLNFPYLDTDEYRPWYELVTPKGRKKVGVPAVGTFSAKSLSRYPQSYQTTAMWVDLLELSMQQHGPTWLHHLHLGIARAEEGGIDNAITHFKASLALNKDNPIALRCIAVLQNTVQDAYMYFMQAWQVALISKDPANVRVVVTLAKEIATFLNSPAFPDSISKLTTFLATVPAYAQEIDAVLMAQLAVWASKKMYDASLAMLSSQCFPTIAADRPTLQKFWYTAQQQKAEAALGRPMTALEARNNRKAFPSPRNIGCKYAGQYCSEYW